MQLVEAADPERRDVRLIVWESYEQERSYRGVARDISDRLEKAGFNRTITAQAVKNWCLDYFGWADGLTIPQPQEPALT